MKPSRSGPDGVRSLLPREKMAASAQKLRDTYAQVPGAPLFRREFGFYCLDRWHEQGMPKDAPFEQLFNYDPPGGHDLDGLGWCEAAFEPTFEEKILEDRGEHEVIQDFAGRALLCFKGRRSGFMPEYLDHPVKNRQTWEDNVEWRLNPKTPQRYENLDTLMQEARTHAAHGLIVVQRIVGGYMYPKLILFGGIDKRILAQSKSAIDREVERILPVMREQGGYIPTCDHGVPEEVSCQNYLHYRKRCVELGG